MEAVRGSADPADNTLLGPLILGTDEDHNGKEDLRYGGSGGCGNSASRVNMEVG